MLQLSVEWLTFADDPSGTADERQTRPANEQGLVGSAKRKLFWMPFVQFTKNGS